MYQSLVTIVPWTTVFQICNLLLQMYLFKRFLYKPVMDVLAKRQSAADAQLKEAEQAKLDADTMKSEYEQNMADAKNKANEILQQATATATARSEEIVSEAHNQATALKQKAEADIAQERKQAVNEIKDEIGGIAMEIASKVVEREINEKDHADLIDEFIKNVGEAS